MFDLKLKEYLQLIEDGLKKFLPSSNEFCEGFSDSIAYSTLDGGKRLRPVLTLAVCEMLNKNPAIAVPFACATEFIHSGSLIHDDLPCMDNANFRRNKPSCHSKFGETAAVLAGDGLFLSAFEVLTKASEFEIKNEKIVKACSFLSEMAGFNGMVLGQAIDMFIEQKLYNKQTLKILSSLKTASLIRAACVLGSFAADVDKQTENKIDEYATHLGIAFQICDDVLDVQGNVEEVGKPLKVDLEKNKLNYINILGLEESKKQAQIQTEAALKIVESFENGQFLVHLTKLMLKRIK